MKNAKFTTRKNVSEVIPSGETILCLESARQKDIFFAGGGTKFKLKNGQAKLFALEFNESLSMKSSIVLRSDSGSSMGISCLNRVKDTDNILVGTNGTLFVVRFHYSGLENSKFEILSTVPDIHSWLVTSIDYLIKQHEIEVFTVSRKDQHFSRVTFPNTLRK